MWKRKKYGYKKTCMHWSIAWFHYTIKIVKEVQPNLKVAQDRQKRYTDLKRTPREFNVWWSRISKGKVEEEFLELGRCSKLATRYCGSFEVLAKIGPVAYQLALPRNIKVHDVFHVSLLQKIYAWCYSYNWLECDSGRT